MHNRFDYRLRLVQTARQQGIKAAARLFQTTVPTVRKGLRRYQQTGLSGLQEHGRAPHHCPHKTARPIERQVLALRRQLPTFGAARLKREFDLAVSHTAIQRIWRAHGLIHKRRRKYQRKQDLAAVKATWRLFQQISADTKDLCDIPRFWPPAQRLRLPLVEYTAREVRSGLLFLAFASRRSAAASAVFAARIQRHLDRCGVELRHLVGQTDNGSGVLWGPGRSRPSCRFPRCPRRQPAPAHPPRRSHLSERRRDRPPPHRRRVLRPGIVPQPSRILCQGHHLSALLQPRTAQLPQGKQNSLADYRATRSSLDLCLLPPINLDYFLNPQGGYHLPLHP